MSYISGTKLKGDIFDYRRLKNKINNSKKLNATLKQSESVLKDYADGRIDVRDKDKKIMAQYIETFSDNYRREHLLNKLQKSSLFDVKKYLADSKRNYWQKLFNLQPETQHISVAGMKRRINKYNSLNRRLSDGWYHSEKDYQKQYIFESEAENYAAGFLKGSIEVTRDEIPTLKTYFGTFQNQLNATNIANALNEIDTIPLSNFAEKRTPLWKRFTQSVKNKWNGMVASFKPKKAVTVKMSRSNWADVAIVSTLFTLAGLSLFKSDSTAKDSRNPFGLEIKKDTAPKQQDTSIKTDAFVPVAAEMTAEQKIWKNFYNTKNEIQAADAKIDLNDLYKKIENKQQAGIFTMPENVSVERFAYTHLMYKAHGLNSPLDAVVNGMQRLSAEQQAAVEEAIKIAGENGVGVKKIAALQSKRIGRALGNHSAYDMASKDLKQKYINSVHAVKNLQQR